jgi:hypothetical protein
MRTISMTVVAAVGLAVCAMLVNKPTASPLTAGDAFHQSSIAIDRLSVNTKNLPVQSFDSF